MAIFRVGQRVRIARGVPGAMVHGMVGKAATIVSSLEWVTCSKTGRRVLCHALSIDGHGERNPVTGNRFGSSPENLEPLTDPKADEFIEKLKRLEREPAPAVVGDKLVCWPQ